MTLTTFRTLAAAAITATLCSSALAQWDPSTGDWGKSDPNDLRVMTWNVQDNLCSSEPNKSDIGASWNAIVRTVAALKPDVLILQECGDNSGNGTGGGVDSQANLSIVMDLFVRGGADPFLGGTVTSYVQLFTGPSYDLPHVYVSEQNDGFNRNVVLSRYPFADLNGGGATYSNFVVLADAYQTGGTPGIRGQQYAEIDLPDETYAGDIVVANSHLKAGGSSSDFADRAEAAENIAYFIDYYYNGAGTGISDPNNFIPLPATGDILDDNTPVVWGGDLNQQPGGFGPAERTTRGGVTGGTDGTDRDRTDSTFDQATQPITGETSTQGSSSKLDYICWQDSIATARRTFVFRSSGSGMTTAQLPSPVDTFPIAPVAASTFASDHRPVVADFILPAAEDPACDADLDDSGALDFGDVSAFLALFAADDPAVDFDNSGSLDFGDVSAFLALFAAGCP